MKQGLRAFDFWALNPLQGKDLPPFSPIRSSYFEITMGNLKKKRQLKMNKHKRRKRLKSNRHKKRTW